MAPDAAMTGAALLRRRRARPVTPGTDHDNVLRRWRAGKPADDAGPRKGTQP